MTAQSDEENGGQEEVASDGEGNQEGEEEEEQAQSDAEEQGSEGEVSIKSNTLGVLLWEGREGWMKEDRRVKRSHVVLSPFQTRDPSHPSHLSRRYKPLRIGDGIPAIMRVYAVL